MLKDSGERKSSHFHRRFTGAKGIGRLSAHKLARLLQVLSTHGKPGKRSRQGLDATIDWDAVERVETLHPACESSIAIAVGGLFPRRLQ